MQDNGSFLTMLEQSSMVGRLKSELQEAWNELRDNPQAYITSALRPNTGSRRRGNLLRVGLAAGVLAYAIAFAAILVFWSVAHNRSFTEGQRSERVLISLHRYWARVNTPAREDGSGGVAGGGGREQNTLQSKGDAPAFLTAPIVGPTPEPQLKPPVLPAIEAVLAEQNQLKRDELSITGSPEGVSGPPSSGPGKGGGIGSGSGDGIGPYGGSGFGHGGRGGTVGRPAFESAVVDTRPVLLNEPRPLYTEDARKNKVQGVVRVRVFVDESGSVKEVVVTRGLPDGLNEQAIRAAYQMRFRPAMKSGLPVSYWLSNVEIEFNLR